MFTISRMRSPLADLQLAASPFNRLFDEAGLSNWIPPVDVIEDQDGVRLAAELPGVKPEDVKITLENNLLTIRGEKRTETPEQNGARAHRYERAYGLFERTFSVPNTVDTDHVRASFEQGVLNIVLPWAERAKARQIEVKVG